MQDSKLLISKFTPPHQYRFIICALCFLLLFIAGCKKDAQVSQIDSSIYKEIKSWLSINPNIIKNETIVKKDELGNIQSFKLNWDELKVFRMEGKTFYQIPFASLLKQKSLEVSASSNSNDLYYLTFQKVDTNKALLFGRIIILSNTKVIENDKIVSGASLINFFDLKGNKMSTFLSTSSTKNYKKLFQSNKTIISQMQSNSNSIKNSSLCAYVSAPIYDYVCSFDPSVGNDYNNTTCGYVNNGYSFQSYCSDDNSPSNSYFSDPFDYFGFLSNIGGGNGGPAAIDAKRKDFDNKISDSLSPCLDSIFSNIKNLKQGKIAEIIQKFSGEIPDWDWQVVESSSNITQTGSTNPVLTPYGIQTTLNPFKLNKGTVLSAVRTILHEAIHAYITMYFKNDRPTANLTFPEIVREYSKQKHGSYEQIQHDEMVRNYVKDIAISLKDYSTTYNLNITDMQIFEDLAWGGLDFQNNSLLSDEDKERISKRLIADLQNTANGDVTPSSHKACR